MNKGNYHFRKIHTTLKSVIESESQYIEISLIINGNL